MSRTSEKNFTQNISNNEVYNKNQNKKIFEEKQTHFN